ncbi:Trihelix transcription factor ASIL2 [Ananas comosus]|uniref:Trihelix transcription factor ASIL2 n=1 Tax=Ananas comosus TaxID=4615 RepID=A0A199VLQ4_ANACO|nr:Trihelix transcription factor ASIL2 [Ananas comosus]
MSALAGEPERRPLPPPPPAPATRRLGPGQPWSHLETVHLIDAYEQRWYALKRGQLKAQQWEEVAAEVAARCGFERPSKTGTQCRHKIEKLRKRYRAERLRPVASPWPYFERIDRMERGPMPISVRPPPSRLPQALPIASSDEENDDAEDDDGAGEDDGVRIASNTRSINGILRESSWGFPRASANSPPLPPRKLSHYQKVEAEDDDDDDDDEDDEEEEAEEDVGVKLMSQVATVVRRFGDGLERLEKRRMELMREIERDWMEMETKRAEMVMESQRYLVETIAGAFASAKKAKKSRDS